MTGGAVSRRSEESLMSRREQKPMAGAIQDDNWVLQEALLEKTGLELLQRAKEVSHEVERRVRTILEESEDRVRAG